MDKNCSIVMKGGDFFMENSSDNPVPGRSYNKKYIKKSSEENYNGTVNEIRRLTGIIES